MAKAVGVNNGKFKHGASRATGAMGKAYKAWCGLKDRCHNPSNQWWSRYGGRGIKVSEEFQEFSVFLDHVGLPPSPKHTIDRIDNDGDYCRGNVRWSTVSEQNRNKRNPGLPPVKILKHRVEIKQLSSQGLSSRRIASMLGISKSLTHRIIRGDYDEL